MFTRQSEVEIDRALHVNMVSDDGRSWHRIRDRKGNWTPFALPPQGPAKDLIAICCTGVKDKLHIVAFDKTSGIWHQVREKNGKWSPLAQPPQSGPGVLAAASIAGTGGKMQVVVCGADGQLWHQLRDTNGSWTNFNTVNGGRFADVSVAGDDDDLHVCGAGINGEYLHRIRKKNGRWTDFAEPSPGAKIKAVGCLAAADHLAVAVLGDDDIIRYQVRKPDTTWTALTPVPTSFQNRWNEATPPALHGAVTVRASGLSAGQVGKWVWKEVIEPVLKEVLRDIVRDIINAASEAIKEYYNDNNHQELFDRDRERYEFEKMEKHAATA